MTTISTEMGDVSWEGNLADDPDITLPSGATVKMQQWISLTNGECLDWLDEHDEEQWVEDVVKKALATLQPLAVETKPKSYTIERDAHGMIKKILEE